MAIVDVSTYIAVYEDGSIKHKSDFEIDKELHKNPSMRIVPIALEKYFVEGIPVEETIKNHKDIFDFCLMNLCLLGLNHLVFQNNIHCHLFEFHYQIIYF